MLLPEAEVYELKYTSPAPLCVPPDAGWTVLVLRVQFPAVPLTSTWAQPVGGKVVLSKLSVKTVCGVPTEG